MYDKLDYEDLLTIIKIRDNLNIQTGKLHIKHFFQ